MGRAETELPDRAIDAREDTLAWKILIVDDEPEVHAVTRLVLGQFQFAGRRLEFLSAHSAAQAHAILHAHTDVAVILLDVVMESEQAGLELVRVIREDLANPHVRIVLRTGQAGQAPEHEVIAAYDINDYKEKTELTSQRLATTMYSALRAYRDIIALETHRTGLEKVIRSSARVFERRDAREFADAVLEQIVDLVGPVRGVLCTSVERDADGPPLFLVDAASGRYLPLVGSHAEEALPPLASRILRDAYADKRHRFEASHFVLHFLDSRQADSLLFVGEADGLSSADTKLMELFCANVSIALENLHLNGELLASQLEMVYLLAGAAETRSQETANHVRRVGLLAEMLGRSLRVDPQTCDLLRYAAPLHDIGKIGIPDSILNKPGSHTPDEMAVMRTHAELGARLLGNSGRPILRLAAQIAASHHENWDGSGYPLGLAGEAIPIGGRITMVADVFDALGSQRCYKAPWDEARIREFMRSQSGLKFDPAVVDMLFERWDEAVALRRVLPD